MKNIRILFYLCASLSTQCMEKKINYIIIPDIKKLQKKHDKLINEMQNYDTHPNIPYHKKHCSEILLAVIPAVREVYKTLLHPKNHSKHNIPCSLPDSLDAISIQSWIKKDPSLQYESDKYSFLGFATMPMRDCVPCLEVSYQEKKDRIKLIQEKGFKVPTNKDHELAFVEKWKRCTPSIIQKIPGFLYTEHLRKADLPQEIINYIAILVFWKHFTEEESLL
ncbi:MAG TPA: hypothetical protein VKU36_05245 [Candidatus Babeliales bacterium]|nr:hypothetical protein [Candidatus Babeliales bacterium]